jgi:hypothetical protein
VGSVIRHQHFRVTGPGWCRLVLHADAVLSLPKVVVAQRGRGPIGCGIGGVTIVLLQGTMQGQGILDDQVHIDSARLGAGSENGCDRAVSRACIQTTELIL